MAKNQRQVHLWVSENEFQTLHNLALERHESVAAFIRGLVRAYRMMYPEPESGNEGGPALPVEGDPRVFG